MVPVSTKMQNEMLLDLARNLRQERLLIGSERQNLQILNQKVISYAVRNHQILFCLFIDSYLRAVLGKGC